ncbi:MAG: aminodeoxychorismate/anthranilate synthase component II [Bacteroidales bacterium]|nr:aminodeoxychorismate/anthranilate synthase component II [Bacteroidales bacterium]OQA87122.1 MAG: Aminodeoxychorismate/anthranilate synthase component 2 [Bacteroidetes bacterium ADurb.Bin234]
MILIDNYDSFTYNIVQYFKEMGVEPQVLAKDETDMQSISRMAFDSIVLSPGPGHPVATGICLDVIHHFHKTKKILGVCLGHQCLAHYFGAKIVQDQNPTHGKTSPVYFRESRLFNRIPQGFQACRYHSLIVDPQTLMPPLEITAQTGDGIIMAIQHRHLPLFGIQFHPEAILTEYGKVLLKNFLEI